MSLQSVILGDSPVSYWELADLTGTVATDSAGSNPGTYNGGYTLNQPGWGFSGPSVLFDGSTGYVGVPTASNLHPTSAISLEALVYPTVLNSNYRMIIEAAYTSNNNPYSDYSLYISNVNTINFTVSIGSTQYPLSSSTLTVNNWYHIVGTYNGSIQDLYINGYLVSSQYVSGSILNSGQSIQIGRSNRGGTLNYYFQGDISNVALYSSALSASKVNNHTAAIGSSGDIRLTQAPVRTLISNTANKIRTTQVPVRTLVVPTNYNVRTTQVPVRTLVSPTNKIRTTQVSVRVIYPSIPPINLWITQLPVRVLVLPSDQNLRVTQLPVRALILPSDQKLRITQQPVRVFRQNTRRPDYLCSDLSNDIFPSDSLVS
jgi:hypothetical protein